MEKGEIINKLVEKAQYLGFKLRFSRGNLDIYFGEKNKFARIEHDEKTNSPVMYFRDFPNHSIFSDFVKYAVELITNA